MQISAYIRNNDNLNIAEIHYNNIKCIALLNNTIYDNNNDKNSTLLLHLIDCKKVEQLLSLSLITCCIWFFTAKTMRTVKRIVKPGKEKHGNYNVSVKTTDNQMEG